MLKSLFITVCVSILLSCSESNALKQASAEKTIREYLSANRVETSQGFINAETVRKIEQTNIYTQFNTSVKVHFENKTNLLFIFTRTSDNKWFLTSVESVDDTQRELYDWLKNKKNLNIPVNNQS